MSKYKYTGFDFVADSSMQSNSGIKSRRRVKSLLRPFRFAISRINYKGILVLTIILFLIIAVLIYISRDILKNMYLDLKDKLKNMKEKIRGLFK